MGPKWLDCPAPNPPKETPKPGNCDCQCEINQAAGSQPTTFLLPLLALLAGGVASC
jgi:matrix metalloproteinase-25 (membrane-inserted)